jgi:hypothetical protein
VSERERAAVRATEEDRDILESMLSTELTELDMLRREKRRIFFSFFPPASELLGRYSATGKNDSLPMYDLRSAKEIFKS